MNRLRWLQLSILGLLTALMGWYVFLSTRIDDDPIRSLGGRTGFADRVFSHYHSDSFFLKKAFFDVTRLDHTERDQLRLWLDEAGYKAAELPKVDPVALAGSLLLHVPHDLIRARLSPEALQKRAQQLLGWATLPGGDVFLMQAAQDPLGLNELVLGRFAPLLPPRDNAELNVYESPDVLSYDRVGALYDKLQTFGDRVWFIGGDFFSLENYRSVQSDVAFCATLTLLLNLALFFFFTRRLVLPGILIAGSLVSYVFGFFAIALFYDKIYAVVLAFTSTFVSFNNEALVHFSGMGSARDERWKDRVLGVASALGTTFLGFVVLLISDSVLIRQMAVCALGAMVGFILFLLCCRNLIRDVGFRSVPLPSFTLPRSILLILSVAGVLAFLAGPRVETLVERFRFESPVMAAQTAHFQQKLDHARLGEFVALSVDQQGKREQLPHHAERTEVDPLVAFWNGIKADQGLWDVRFGPHPLDYFQSLELQTQSATFLDEAEGPARAQLHELLRAGGVDLFGGNLGQQAGQPQLSRVDGVVDAEAYLSHLEKLSPLRWHAQIDDRWVLYAPVIGDPSGLLTHTVPGLEALSLNPARYYNTMLSDLSEELALLFLAGLAVMCVYLLIVQRTIWRVLYIVAPVILSVGALALLTAVQRDSLNILHFMGLSLTIALAMDYTSVAVSARHHPEDLTKVLLTGMSSLVTFGVLIFATHPVLKTLGVTVTLGCGVGLVFALVLPLREPRSKTSALLPWR